jgi:hypothetical protein
MQPDRRCDAATDTPIANRGLRKGATLGRILGDSRVRRGDSRADSGRLAGWVAGCGQLGVRRGRAAGPERMLRG